MAFYIKDNPSLDAVYLPMMKEVRDVCAKYGHDLILPDVYPGYENQYKVTVYPRPVDDRNMVTIQMELIHWIPKDEQRLIFCDKEDDTTVGLG